MEELHKVLFEAQPFGTRSISVVDGMVRRAIAEDSEAALAMLAEFFCSENTGEVVKNFVLHTARYIASRADVEKFKEKCGDCVEKSFWQSEDPNFFALRHHMDLFGAEATFAGNEVALLRSMKTANTLPLETIAAIFKAFVPYIQSIDLSLPLPEDMLQYGAAYYSVLAGCISECLAKDSDFEVITSLTDSLAQCLPMLSEEEIQRIKSGLRQQQVLVLEAFEARTAEGADSLLNALVEQLNKPQDMSDRVLLYFAFQVITKYVSDLPSFVELSIRFFMKDFDSASGLIGYALRKVLSAVFRRAKKEECIKQISSLYLQAIMPLSWNSKLKAWMFPILVPELIDSTEDVRNVFYDLVNISQDPSETAFVTKCIQPIAQSPKMTDIFIDSCFARLNEYTIVGSAPFFRPLFEKLFRFNKELIAPIMNRTQYLEQRHAAVLMRFEVILHTPKAMIPTYIAQIREDLGYAFFHGNWDLRVEALSVYAFLGFPTEESDTQLLVDALPGLIYMDSAKHMMGVKGAFERMVPKLRGHEAMVEAIVAYLLPHLTPASLSARRGYVLDILIMIWKEFPAYKTEEAMQWVATILEDFNSDLRRKALGLLNVEKVKEEVSYGIEGIRTLCINVEDNDFFLHELPGILLERLNSAEPLSTMTSAAPARTGHVNTVYASTAQANEEQAGWEYRAEFFQLLGALFAKFGGRLDRSFIAEAAELVFSTMLSTRHLGLVSRGQNALELIAKALYTIPEFAMVPEGWNARLVEVLESFDMENMRRGASLPFIAVALIRADPGSKAFHMLLSKLLEIIRGTSSVLEATNALNILRSIVLEKETIVMIEPFIPELIQILFTVVEKLPAWDVVDGVNLVFVAITRKIWRRFGKESFSFSLSRSQFFYKMPTVRTILIDALKSKVHHSNYLALQIFLNFEPETYDDSELVEAVMIHFGAEDVRIRRAAARAFACLLSPEKREAQFEKLFADLPLDKSNALHGTILALNELISCGFRPMNCPAIAEFDTAKISPAIWKDLYVLLEAVGKENLLPIPHIAQGRFLRNEVALLTASNTFQDDLNTSSLVAYINQFPADAVPKQEVLDKLVRLLIVPGLESVNHTLAYEGLRFLVAHVDKVMIRGKRLVKLINKVESMSLQASLIALLKYATDIPETMLADCINTKLIQLAYSVTEAMTDVHIALSIALPRLLFVSEGLLVAVRLLSDDIPLVRTNAAIAVTSYFKCEFESAIRLIERVFKAMTVAQLERVVILWSKNIAKREDIDAWAEPLCVFVDDFFYLTKPLEYAGIEVPVPESGKRSLSEMRKHYLDFLVDHLENHIQ